MRHRAEDLWSDERKKRLSALGSNLRPKMTIKNRKLPPTTNALTTRCTHPQTGGCRSWQEDVLLSQHRPSGPSHAGRRSRPADARLHIPQMRI